MRTRTLRILPIIAMLLALASCAPQVGSAGWCEKMKETPVTEWSMANARDYANHCILPGTTIGSARWCEGMRKLPKGDWSANQAADFARYCVVGSN
jgi:hypothetical protein